MFEKVLAVMLAMLQLAAAADDTAAADQGPMGIYSANQKIGQWINPNAFVGILLTIIFFTTSYCVFGLMAQIQTPRIMLEKELDWGKVEKVDE